MNPSQQSILVLFASKRRLVYVLASCLGLSVAIPKVMLAWQSQGSLIHRFYYPIFIVFIIWVIYALMRKRVPLEKAEIGGMKVLIVHHFIGLSAPLLLANITVEALYLEFASVNIWFLMGICAIAFAVLPLKKGALWAFCLHGATTVLLLLKAYSIAGQSNEEVILLLRFLIMSGGLLVFMYALAIFREDAVTARLKTEMIEKLAYQDSLTETANRRKILEVLDTLKSSAQNFSVVLWDIDHFKQVNDRYGHDIGDLVLQNLAQLARKHIRKNDYVGRWGGEEFIFVLSDTSSEEAYHFTERFRATLEQQTFEEVGGVTASFGVASFNHEAVAELLKRADDVLYEAKRAGRNRVVLA